MVGSVCGVRACVLYFDCAHVSRECGKCSSPRKEEEEVFSPSTYNQTQQFAVYCCVCLRGGRDVKPHVHLSFFDGNLTREEANLVLSLPANRCLLLDNKVKWHMILFMLSLFISISQLYAIPWFLTMFTRK